MSGGPIIPVGEVLPAMDLPPDRTPPQKTEPAGRDGKRKPKRSAGRWQTLNAFCDLSARTLSGPAVAVWLILFRWADKGGIVRISQAELARCVGKSPRRVHAALKQLEAAGVLSVVRRGSLRGGVSTYQVRSRGKNGL